MSDQTKPQPRIFVIGGTRIVEDESLAGLDIEAARAILKNTYPEVAHATLRERDDPHSSSRIIEFHSKPGTKG